jgi:hypothetical protein
MQWRRAFALVVAGLVVIGGCSGDGGEEAGGTTTTFESYVPPPGPSLEDWQAQATAVCETYEPQLDAIVAAHGEPTSLDDVVAFIDDLLPIAQPYMEEFNAIEVPAARRTDIERVYQLNRSSTEAATRLRAAAARSDQNGYAAAVSELSGQNREINDLLLDLEVPVCAQEEEPQAGAGG